MTRQIGSVGTQEPVVGLLPHRRGWAVLWGFLTAASRVTAAGEFYPEVWEVVDRAPNFMLPAALIWLVYQHRLDHRPAATLTAPIGRTADLTQ